MDEDRMRHCLVTEASTLLQLSGVKKIKSIFFGGGKVSMCLSPGSDVEGFSFFRALLVFKAIEN